MGNIDKFLAKPTEVTIGEEQYMIKPFTVNDIDVITKMGSKDDNVKTKALKDAIFKVMKQIDDSVTVEQVNDVSLEFLEDIMNAITQTNNIDISDAKAKLIADMKQ